MLATSKYINMRYVYICGLSLKGGTGNRESGNGNGERGTGNGEQRTGNGERGTENGESLKWGIFKSGNL